MIEAQTMEQAIIAAELLFAGWSESDIRAYLAGLDESAD